jgi:hypothetical protein
MRAAEAAPWKKLPIKRRLAVKDNIAATARLGQREYACRLVFEEHSSSYMDTKHASLKVCI